MTIKVTFLSLVMSTASCMEVGGGADADLYGGKSCGNGKCTGKETCENCPADCGVCEAPPSVCGDEICAADEDCGSCEADCGVCGSDPVCGDAVCDDGAGENCASCEDDCGVCSLPDPNDPVRAFPGAEGFGADSVGGRGGDVYKVTNLDDSGSGSLRACAEGSGKRICVFDVGGTIILQDQIKIDEPYITIAGQTAPGGGITLRSSPSYSKAGIKIATHDVTIRGIRVRTGPTSSPSSMRRGIAIEEASQHIIIDHCSVSWATDDNVTLVDGPRDITVQYSIISEALSESSHTEGEHSKGFAISGKSYTNSEQTGRVTLYRNLLAHNRDRNPRQASWGVVDVVNNLIYNWTWTATEANDRQTEVPLNVIKNFYKVGPDTSSSAWEVEIDTDNGNGAAVYVEGNIGPRRTSDSMPASASVDPDQHGYLIGSPHPSATAPAMSAWNAYDEVLQNAGAQPRDAVDTRVVDDVINGTGHAIDDPSDVGGWPTLSSGTPLVDSSGDGIPDQWATANGLDPDQDNANGHDLHPGYTNIEVYINSLFN